MFGFGKKKKGAKKKKKGSEIVAPILKGIHAILAKLEPEKFFHVEEKHQLIALDGLNKFIVTQDKMFEAIAAGMLDTVTNLVKLANDFHLLPVPHARIMETVQTLVAIPSLKVRFGVEANLCNVLVGEMQELVDQILKDVKETEARDRADKREQLITKREKAGAVTMRKRGVNMMFTFVSGDQPIGITVGVPPLKPKGGVIAAMQWGSQCTGATDDEWARASAELVADAKLLDEEKSRILADGSGEEYILAQAERAKRELFRTTRAFKRLDDERKSENSPKLVNGDEIIKINNKDIQHKTNAQIQKLLDKTKRPFSVYFHGLRDPTQLNGNFWKAERDRIRDEQVKEKEAAFFRRKVEKEKADNKKVKDAEKAIAKAERKKKKKEDIARKEQEGMDFAYEVVFGEGSLGLALKGPKNGGLGCIVHNIVPGSQAAKMGTIKVGHRPVRIGQQLVIKTKIKDIMTLIGKQKRPLTVKFKGREKLKANGEAYSVVFYKGPMGVKLIDRTGSGPLGDGVSVGHVQANGFAERTGDIGIGDIITK